MYLNSDQTKINNFLLNENKKDISDSFCELISKGFKISIKDIKSLLKFVRFEKPEELSKKLLELFEQSGISIKLNSTNRVKKHREHVKAKGYKILSFSLSPADYEKLKTMKNIRNMTYSELIVFLMSHTNEKSS